EMVLEHGDQREADGARVLVGFLDGDVAADLAGWHRPALRVERALARQIDEVAGLHGMDIGAHRAADFGQRNAKLLETLFDFHGWLTFGRGERIAATRYA